MCPLDNLVSVCLKRYYSPSLITGIISDPNNIVGCIYLSSLHRGALLQGRLHPCFTILTMACNKQLCLVVPSSQELDTTQWGLVFIWITPARSFRRLSCWKYYKWPSSATSPSHISRSNATKVSVLVLKWQRKSSTWLEDSVSIHQMSSWCCKHLCLARSRLVIYHNVRFT